MLLCRGILKQQSAKRLLAFKYHDMLTVLNNVDYKIFLPENIFCWSKF